MYAVKIVYFLFVLFNSYGVSSLQNLSFEIFCSTTKAGFKLHQTLSGKNVGALT